MLRPAYAHKIAEKKQSKNNEARINQRLEPLDREGIDFVYGTQEKNKGTETGS